MVLTLCSYTRASVRLKMSVENISCYCESEALYLLIPMFTIKTTVCLNGTFHHANFLKVRKTEWDDVAKWKGEIIFSTKIGRRKRLSQATAGGELPGRRWVLRCCAGGSANEKA